LDNSHVIFGKVVKGRDTIKQLEKYGDKLETVLKDIVMITDCGEVNPLPI
jgi:cyclophilin family peptidyl-prolyl cis-trans isomerase